MPARRSKRRRLKKHGVGFVLLVSLQRGCKMGHQKPRFGRVAGNTPPKRMSKSLYWVMEKRIYPQAIESVVMPEPFGQQSFDDAEKAVAALQVLYDRNTKFLRDSFAALAAGGDDKQALPRLLPGDRRHHQFVHPDRLAPGLRPHADAGAFLDHHHPGRCCSKPISSSSFRLIMRNHGVPVTISESTMPIPLAFGLPRRHRCPSASSSSASSGRSATCSMFPILTAPTTRSPTAFRSGIWRKQGRWRRSPPSASTIP